MLGLQCAPHDRPDAGVIERTNRARRRGGERGVRNVFLTMPNAPMPGFSEMFGLGPLPVSYLQKTGPASALLRVSQTPNDSHSIVRVFHGNVMVGAVTKAGEPGEDLKQPLSVFAARYG